MPDNLTDDGGNRTEPTSPLRIAPFADYDGLQTLAISPWGLHDTAKTIVQLAQDIADSLGRISDTLGSLTFDSWKGETQQEVDDMADRWLDVSYNLFGSEDTPNDGVLNAVADGIGIAGDNYNKAEIGLVNIWHKFAANVGTGDGSDEQKDKPADQMDTNKTAITADY
ncbi:hypothetical protein [Actinomadura sp. DC4]|uniref:hypothetical protein n=1 Tax=Actinomadura sp. DC4 TaxID=3055069 RepID=UPI0025AEE281|nr:hypothetical protein [Actinomadura sp. DC4]MDN3354937.1 hypothetical protein [Actinomadura sp. DC4]